MTPNTPADVASLPAKMEALAEVIAFLQGEAPMNGCWFGEAPLNGDGRYWWRKPLREAIATLTPAGEGGLPEPYALEVGARFDQSGTVLVELIVEPNSQEWTTGDKRGLYTADQMRAYGEQCRRLATPEQPAINLDACVDRFLGWKLPDDFGPDCGIAFTPLGHPNGWPIGTNLLTAVQARAMLEYVLNWTAGAPSAQQPLDGPANNAGVATGSRNGPPSESVTRGNPPSTLAQPGSSVQGEKAAIEAAALYAWKHASWSWEAVKGGLDRFTTPPPAPAAEHCPKCDFTMSGIKHCVNCAQPEAREEERKPMIRFRHGDPFTGKLNTLPSAAPAAPGVRVDAWRGVAAEAFTNIKRACIRGRNAANMETEKNFVATCDHIENLADEGIATLAPDGGEGESNAP